MNRTYSEFKSLVESILNPSMVANCEDVKSWTSMQSLIVVSAIDEHYDVIVTFEDLQGTATLKHLYEVVVNKSA